VSGHRGGQHVRLLGSCCRRRLGWSRVLPSKIVPLLLGALSELCALTWDQIDFSQGMMHVRRIKNGIASVQQIGGEEMRMLRALKREDAAARYVFMTERGAPMTAAGFRKLLSRLAVAAKFPFSVHPHMLRHATGYKLANDGRDTRALQHYLGHKNIMHTVRYTELSPERFKNFWED
jgi:type 1 fimbriae regulatory protein FimE